MKKITFLIILLASFFLPNYSCAQTVLFFDSFEEDPSSKSSELGYTTDVWRDGFSDWFNRISNVNSGNPAPTEGYHTFSGLTANIDDEGIGNKYFFGGDDINDDGNPRIDDLGIITFNNANVNGKSDLKLRIALAQGRQFRFETDDYIRIYYAFDSDITAHPETTALFSEGSYSLLAEFKGADLSSDLSQDGLGVTILNTGSFNDYTFDIPTTGTLLSIRIVVKTNGGDEEILLDNMRILGSVLTTPTVTTTTASNIISTSATLGGNVTNDGGAAITERGVVYSTSDTTPTIAEGGTKDTNSSGTGVFSETVSNLIPGTTYYFSSYAINSIGTSYGATQSFTTEGTILAFQSFESNSLDTWNYTADPVPYATEIDSIIEGSEDIWSVIREFTGDIDAASNGDNFWGTQDLNNNNGGRNSFHTLTFNPINVSTKEQLTLEFDYFSKGFDSSDMIEYEVLFDNGTAWSANGTVLAKSNLAWETISVNVPASANYVRLRIQVKQDGSADHSGWDNIKLYSNLSVNNSPTVAATTITQSSIASTSMTVGWTNGNGERRIVIAKAGSAVSVDPTDGNGYTPNAAFGSGTDLGSSNFIVYDGTGTSVNLTGLTAGTTYHFKVIEVNGTNETANYFLTGAPTGSRTTLVPDTTKPVITVCAPTPANISANASCQGTTPDFTGLVTATDNSGVTPTITQNPPAGATLGLGTTTITITATDGSGNTTTCTVNQTVVDSTKPSVSCPGNQTETPNGSGTYILSDYRGVSTATDNCSGSPTVTQSPAAGTVLTQTTTVTITATDGTGNTDTCTFDVIILDNTAPVFENSTPSSSNITQTSFTLNTDIDEAGTIYYVVVAKGATTPTSVEVKAGTGNGGSGQITSGNAAVSTGSFTNAFSVTGLTVGTAYDVYVVAQDDEGTPNLRATPTKIDVTTKSLIPLTITGLTGNDKEYDGTTVASASGTAVLSATLLSGFGFETDDVNLSGSPVYNFTTASIGTGISITTTGYALSGSDAGKYTLIQPTLSANITAISVNLPHTLTFNTTDNTNLGKITSDGKGGTSDIIGRQFNFEITNNAGNITGEDVIYKLDSGANGLSTVNYEIYGMSIKTNDGSEFDFNGFTANNFFGQDTQKMTITGFRDGLTTGSISFESVGMLIVSDLSNAVFGNVDEVRITMPINFYLGSFNDFRLAEPSVFPTITFANINKVYGDGNFDLAATSNSSGIINYSIVAGGTGTASLLGINSETVNVGNAGTVIIRATQTADGIYNSNTKDIILTINKATLTATADDKTKEYGDSNPAFTVSYTGFKGSDSATNLDTAPTVSSTATTTTNVGTAVITTSVETDNNYTIVPVDGSLTIGKAPLTATADDKGREYGDSNPAFTVSYSGFKGSDSATDLDTAPTASSTATATTNVGTAVITTSVETDNNYTIVPVDGSLTIGKAPLTAIADHKSKEYGDSNPAFTVSYTGFKGTDSATDLDTAPLASTIANTTTDAGIVDITMAAGTDTNYAITTVKGTLTIAKAALFVTAKNTTVEYGDNFSIGFEYGAFKNGEDASVLDTGAYVYIVESAPFNAGTYTIRPDAVSDNNYIPNYVDGTLTVTKAALTATANDKIREYGEDNPAFTLSYSGFKGTDRVTDLDTAPIASSLATRTTDVGTEVITASGGTDNNYTIVPVNGTLTIGKATLTVTADDKTKVYGDTDPTLIYRITGFVGADQESDLDTPVSISRVTGEGVGNYVITPSGATDANYSINFVSSSFSITKAILTVIADHKTKEYRDVNPVFTISYDGFVGSDNEADLDVIPTVSSTAIITSDVGTVTILVSLGSDNNYEMEASNGALTIEKATLVATADNKSKIFGAANPVFTITYDGFKGTDTIGDIDTTPVATSSSTNTTPVGTVSIDLSAGSDNNYRITTINGTLTILLDTDGDGIADGDDTDDDNDGVLDDDDNSPLIPNPDQKDTDGDGLADVEEDCDNDGIINYYDTDVASCQEPILMKKKYGFSPNGDGVNDTWVVEDIELFPNNVVNIYNRSGKLVFTMKGYGNTYDGTFKGKKLPVGAYLYIIDLGNGSQPTRGWIYINY